MTIERILFATDFAQHTDRAEETTLELAQALKAALIVLHVIEAIDPSEDEDPMDDFYRGLREQAEVRLTAIIDKCTAAGVRAEKRVTVGKRWLEIVEIADRERCNLIVLGGHAIDPSRAQIGVTSHKVFFACRVPLLTVRDAPAEPTTPSQT
jgi:nucleotide-binding universal stress UspA family protein